MIPIVRKEDGWSPGNHDQSFSNCKRELGSELGFGLTMFGLGIGVGILFCVMLFAAREDAVESYKQSLEKPPIIEQALRREVE